MANGPILTSREAAAYLRVCERTLATLKGNNKIPFIKIGKAVRFDIGDLDAFIASQKSRPCAVQTSHA